MDDKVADAEEVGARVTDTETEMVHGQARAPPRQT